MSTPTRLYQHFANNPPSGRALTTRAERALLWRLVPHIPGWIHSYHLTLATIPISILTIACGYLARGSIHWLWGVAGLVVLQWITDTIDGELGRYRREGLVWWGYYMDHLLDFLFLASVFVSFAFLLQGQFLVLHLALFAVIAMLMVSSFLNVTATGTLQVCYFHLGPTELRLLAVLSCAAIIFFGIDAVVFVLVPAVVVGLGVLTVLVYQTQHLIRTRIDDPERRAEQ